MIILIGQEDHQEVRQFGFEFILTNGEFITVILTTILYG